MSSSTNSFYVTGGTLRLDAPSYVERQADRDLFESLLQGEFCYVLTSRQMGKSSLMVRTANKLRSQGAHVIALDLSAIGQNLTPGQWYNGLLTSMGDQLGLEDELEQFWIANERLGPVQRWFSSIRKAVLAWRRGKVVFFLDEIDSVRSLPFSTDEFFAAIRECYNRRSEDPEFSRMTFCLLGVATPSDLIRDTRITPFNIGRRIELNDFTPEEAAPLARGLHTDGAPRVSILLKRVLYWTSGHPYLTQRLCHALARDLQARRRGDVDRVCEELFFSNRARERDDNLIFVRERMLRSEADLRALLDLYLDVRNGKRVADEETNPLVSIMRLSGIVRSEQGRLQERNHIYSRAFDRLWVKTNLPDADLRWQRAAFLRGVFRTAGIAAVVVAAMTIMVLIALKQTGKARRALAQSYVSEAQARGVGAASGQRFESLEAIKRAVPLYTNQLALRDLAITTLSLMDLRECRKRSDVPMGTRCVALNAGFSFYASGDFEGNISIRSTTNEQEIVQLPGSGIATELLQFSPNNQYLAAKYKAGTTNELVVWDWQFRSAILRLPLEINGRAMDFSADNRRVAVGQAGRILVYSLETGTISRELLLQLPDHLPRRPNCIRFHPSENLLAESGDSSGLVQIWNLDSATAQLTNYHRAPVLDLAWHPDGELLASACEGGEIYLWDRRAPQSPYKVLRGHESDVILVAFNHQGDLLASWGADQSIRLWIPSTGRQMIHPLDVGQMESLLFSADDLCLGFDRINSKIRIWEVNPAREYRVLIGQAGGPYELQGIDFSPDGRFLAGASPDGIILWDPECGKRLEAPPMMEVYSEMSIRSALFDPLSGDLMASDAFSGFLRWSIRPIGNGRESRFRQVRRANLELPSGLGKFALSLDGKTVAVVNRNEGIYVFNPGESGKHVRLKVEAHYQSLALSPDGKYLAANRIEGKQIEIWDVSARAPVPNLPRLDGGEFFTFSPDGQWFVTSSPRSFFFWQVGTWQRGQDLRHSGNQPGPMAFSRDGGIFAMAVSPTTIELIQFPSRERLARLENPDRRRLLSLTFSPDARRLAAASTEQLVLMWDLALISRELSELNLRGKLPAFPEKSLDARPLAVEPEHKPAEPGTE